MHQMPHYAAVQNTMFNGFMQPMAMPGQMRYEPTIIYGD